MKTKTVAVVSANSAIGEEILSLLAEWGFRKNTVRALSVNEDFAEQNDEGDGGRSDLHFGDTEISLEPLDDDTFTQCDVAIFAGNEASTKKYVPKALAANCVAIDTTRAFRHDSRACLVNPISLDEVVIHRGLLALPHAVTSILLPILDPIHDRASCKRIVATVFQPVSDQGYRGIRELEGQISDLLNMRSANVSVFPDQVAFNLLPETADFTNTEDTLDESEIAKETKMLLDEPTLGISITCVRVPIFFSSCLSVNIETEKELSAKHCRALLTQAEGVHVLDNPREHIYPTPIQCTGENSIFVGRIRNDASAKHALNLWISGDNIKTALALPAVRITEALFEQNLLTVTKNLLDSPSEKAFSSTEV